LDAGEAVCHQVEAKASDTPVAAGRHLHRQWHASLGACPVASIPLFANDACVAIVSLRNRADQLFTKGQLAKIQELLTPMMPGLLLLQRANRSATRYALDGGKAFVRTLVAPGSTRRKIVALLMLAFSAWVVFGKAPYCPTASCTVRPTDDLQLSAPFEGTIAEALAEPGDRVVAGQRLARLDTRNLEKEREKLLSEKRRAEIATTRASQAGDLSGAAQAHAESAIANARLQLVANKLAAATIRAPQDGVILEGRLDTRLGEVVSLGEPLLRFAPRDHWQVNVHVPDRLAPQIRAGQSARLAVSARPEIVCPLHVERIHAASQVDQGKNVFTAVARFSERPPDWIRAGMVGVARVDAGERPVWWVWAHRIVDSIKLQLFKF
ncbi:MAG: HlyD family efflux transporter periplasmic adaptor subunit, partial [Planctomycetota bacterium]